MNHLLSMGWTTERALARAVYTEKKEKAIYDAASTIAPLFFVIVTILFAIAERRNILSSYTFFSSRRIH